MKKKSNSNFLDSYPYNIILGSNSPRRKQLLEELGFDFKCRVSDCKEVYFKNLTLRSVPCYLAQLKAESLKNDLKSNELLMTLDTVVIANQGQELLGKPRNGEEAKSFLEKIQGKEHQTITGVCFQTTKQQWIFDCVTKVYFRKLKINEIDYWLENFKFLDKAGAYGIQDWIGHIGIEKIEGSYTNVMGVPTHLIYSKLFEILN